VTISHRDQPDKPETVELGRNLPDKPETNVRIRPGDTLDVHRAPIVYIIGDVGRPSGLMVETGKITLLQAIALAGGPNRTAKLNGTRIIRKSDGPNGMTQTPVKLKQMLEAKAADIPLEANDIVYVPVSGGKLIFARSMEAAMSVTTSLAVYSVHP